MNKILMVEDDSTIAFAVKYALEQEGFLVDIAATVKIAKEKLQSEYDLILLDIGLPDGNGYELCEYIRNTSEVGVIFLTACDEEVNIVMGLDIGGDDYVTKPFRVKELISRIKAVLRRKSKINEVDKKIIEENNLRVHTLEARVFKNSEEIFLTSAEYKLLLILIQNKNKILSRVQILEKLWDVSYDFVNDNTLTVYIKRLREKIEDNQAEPKFIKTVRGLGYKFVGCDNNDV